jgi:expansin (peptidoglycan-binding protein)
MAVGPSHRRRIPRRRLLGIEIGGAIAVGAIAVAVAVGVSQATSSPACASVVTATGAVRAAAAARAQETSAQETSAQETSAQETSAQETSGEATHYVLQPGDGNCSYPAADTDQLYVALPPAEYGAAAACGSYLEITGPDGSVTAEVVDQCPDCQSGHIDLGEQAFARIAPLAAGLVPVTYHTIIDPPLPAPLSLRVKEGSSAYWLALLPIDNGNPVTSVRVSSPSKGWQDMAHASYNYWLAPSGMGPGPFTVQLTDSAGHQVTVTGISLSPGVVQATGTPMYGAGATSAAAAFAGPASADPTVAHTASSPAPARPSGSQVPSRASDIAAATPKQAAAPNLAAASPTPSC